MEEFLEVTISFKLGQGRFHLASEAPQSDNETENARLLRVMLDGLIASVHAITENHMDEE